MADPTARVNITYSDIDTGRETYVIKDAVALVVGGHASKDPATGEIEFSGTDAHIPVGFVLGSADGNNDNLTGNSDGTNKAVCRGKINAEVNVTGVNGIDDLGKDVFASDGQTFTLTNPAAAIPCGIVKRHISGTLCVVYFYDAEESKVAGHITDFETRIDALENP